jgi:hypothetical protein
VALLASLLLAAGKAVPVLVGSRKVWEGGWGPGQQQPIHNDDAAAHAAVPGSVLDSVPGSVPDLQLMTGLGGGLGGQPSLLVTGAGVALFVMALSQVRQLAQVSLPAVHRYPVVDNA